MSQPKWVAVAVMGLVAAGCGSGAAPLAGPTTTTTQAVATTAERAQATAAARTCTVPDVVGMVHQSAQDSMQAAGLHRLREEDATGRGRALVLDRNWTTTGQSPPAGAVVDCDTEVLLSAKKTGE